MKRYYENVKIKMLFYLVEDVMTTSDLDANENFGSVNDFEKSISE